MNTQSSRLLAATCSDCGKVADPTPAFMAAGMRHPACRFTRVGLTASARGTDLDRLALDLWGARQRLAAIVRKRRQQSGQR